MKWLHCYIIKSPTGVFTKYQKNRHHVGAVKINWWNHFRKIAVCRSRSLLQIAGSSFRKLNRKERKGGGLVGRILRSSHLTFCVLHEENMSSRRSDTRGTEQSKAVENQGEKYFRKHRLSTLTKLRDGFCFSFFFLFCLLFLSWLGEGGVVQ